MQSTLEGTKLSFNESLLHSRPFKIYNTARLTPFHCRIKPGPYIEGVYISQRFSGIQNETDFYVDKIINVVSH